MYLFEGLKERLASYLDSEQVELIRQAYILARDAHDGQSRSSGEPYITHPVAVTGILADMHLDHETLCAALMHDTIEDTPVSKEQIAEQFGDPVAELVEGVSKLDKIQFNSRQEAQAENFRKMILAMTQDIRVILIKLADRTHNMRTLGALRPDKKRRIARETLEIYAPLASRLGIHNIKNELEDLGFEALHPMRQRVLRESVKRATGNRKQLMDNIKNAIVGRLEEQHISGDVQGREKHLYSLYNKMRNKELQFHEVMDIIAFRIVVKDLDTCYRVLGAMHNLYKPKPGRFKDYIAIPKANGYQSLHTTLVGPHGVPVEIQIRTEDMDLMADRGVAAHWLYKQDGENAGTTAQVRARRWMQSLLDLQQSAGNSFEFIENVKTDLFPDEIYVFTPDGRILELPAGATPVDFAYAVHTDVGHSCVGARVDRQPYPLSMALENGQTVEIITSPGARPNAAWLNFVVTSKARAKIRSHLKLLKSEEAIALGRRLLKHALGGKPFAKLDEARVKEVLESTQSATFDDLLANIGLGNAMSIVIARRLEGMGGEEDISKKPSASGRNKLPIRGAEGMLISFAKCCRPIPGDPIVAHMSPGKGLVVHQESCGNITGYQSDPLRYIPVQWEDGIDGEFITEVRVDILNHQGALATLTSAISSAGASIQNLSTEERDSRLYAIYVQLTTHNRVHLANVMRRIRKVPEVVKVARVKR
ncbi:bifunctional GTP diphosphokinase/guanosine-3',5'-bis pyrophosphate 3'-pyrophosphohydrolase [Gallaecimonas sp. GXIMD1310]|uniref:bifunctional GTP diphosphokinase/guanosine-3',5'-bis pyrophosphate 3'-pyrophosphohydrolase n=1 Tax=Gallaecimonas sp. GXIMD1310 TaxID=3131926 RepID=UPI00324EFD2E